MVEHSAFGDEGEKSQDDAAVDSSFKVALEYVPKCIHNYYINYDQKAGVLIY